MNVSFSGPGVGAPGAAGGADQHGIAGAPDQRALSPGAGHGAGRRLAGRPDEEQASGQR